MPGVTRAILKQLEKYSNFKEKESNFEELSSICLPMLPPGKPMGTLENFQPILSTCNWPALAKMCNICNL